MERMFRGRRGGVYGAAGLLVATWLLAGGSVSVRGETMPSPVAAGDSSVQITDGAKNEVSEKPFRVFELTSRRPDVAVFVGSADYAKTTTIAFEASGRLAYVRAVGLPAKSEIFKLDGGVVRKGELLARQDTEIPLSELRIAEAKLNDATLQMQEKTENYERDRKLHERGAVSSRQFLESKTAYESAGYNRLAAESELARARRVYEGCFSRAPFPCVVAEVYLSAGTVADVAQAVMKIALVEAMKVTVRLPEYVTRRLDPTTQVLVYPEGAVQPVVAWFDSANVGTGTLSCYVDNPRIPVGSLTQEQEKLPEIDELSFVFEAVPSNQSLAPLWVKPEAVRSDAEGDFVWRLRGVKAFTAGQPIPREAVLEKVRVKGLDLEFHEGIYRLRGIEAIGELSPYDLLAGQVPDTVKSGDRVVFRASRRLFRAGERVNVVLSRSFDRHLFPVPRTALKRNEQTGAFEVLLWHDEKLMPIPVALTGEMREYVLAEAPELQAGARLVVSDSGSFEGITPAKLRQAEVVRLAPEEWPEGSAARPSDAVLP